MNLLVAIALFCALPLAILLAARLVSFAAGSGEPRSKRGPLVLLIVLAVVGVGTYGIRQGGRPVRGIVSGKSESLEPARRGLAPGVTHRLVLTVVAENPIDPLYIDVDERSYDSLREGQPVDLHERRLGPLSFARLDTVPWWNLAPGRLEHVLFILPATGPMMTGRAVVESFRTVRDAYILSFSSTAGATHVELSQPYDEVRFSFLSESGARILALDRIDAGSAGTLAPGSQLDVLYRQGRPRTARLMAGRRTFEWRNARDTWGSVILAVAALLILAGVAVRLRRGFPGR